MVKQVIVVNKALRMRAGKIASQVAHASLAVILDNMDKFVSPDSTIYYTLTMFPGDSMYDWLIKHSFTKIVLGISSEEGLLSLYNRAKEAKLPCSLITDNGTTVFNGIPTNTCIAIGPADSDKIDAITGGLPLL